MSRSKSSSATSTSTRDHRVAGDNGAIGVSTDGDVHIEITSDEAFALAENALAGFVDITAQSIGFAEGSQGVLSRALEYQTTAAKSEPFQIAELLVTVGFPALAVGLVIYGALKK